MKNFGPDLDDESTNLLLTPRAETLRCYAFILYACKNVNCGTHFQMSHFSGRLSTFPQRGLFRERHEGSKFL